MYGYYPSVFEFDPSKRAEIRFVSESGYSVSNLYLIFIRIRILKVRYLIYRYPLKFYLSNLNPKRNMKTNME
jgi:hypothetical protein